MNPASAALIATLLLAVPAHSSGADAPATYDGASQTVMLPAVFAAGSIYSNVVLQLGDDGLFALRSVGPVLAAGTPVPAYGAYLFPEKQRVLIPRVVHGNGTYRNVRLTTLPSGKFSVAGVENIADAAGTGQTVRIVNALTVPAAIADIAYPETYTAAAAYPVDADDPYCNPAPGTLSVPASFYGGYPLPNVSGEPFSPSVKLGAGLKDVWQVGNPSYNAGCAGDVREAFLRTLARLQAVGARFVEITPWTFFDPSGTNWEIRNPGALNTSTMSDPDLEWAVQTAHQQGFEVHWINQIQGAIDSSIPAATPENVRKFLAAYEPYLLDRAALLQRLGVEVMMIGCACWFYPAGDTEALYLAKLADLAPRVKAVFSGKLRMWASPALYANAPLKEAVDLVEMNFLNPPLSPEEGNRLTVGLLKEKYLARIAGWSNVADSSKPVVWNLGAPSRPDFFTTGYVEESFCTSATDVIAQTGSACLQRALGTDFAFQAMVYAAELEAIREQTAFRTYGVTTPGYWMTDNLLPQSTFPNIAFSVRNKPAEALLRHWFAR